jgi:AraC-like DNA-binding protein
MLFASKIKEYEMVEKTTSAAWVRSIVDLLENARLDVAAIFAEAGLDLATLNEPHSRYPSDGLSRLWEVIALRSGDPAIGIAIPGGAKPANLDVVTYAMISCPDLLAGLERLVRYLRIISDAAVIAIEQDRDGYWLSIDLQGGHYPVPRQRFEFILITLLHFSRWITCRDVQPLAVDFVHPAPADPEPYRKAFGGPLRFDAPLHRMLFSHADLRRALPTSNPLLADLHDRYAGEYLERMDHARISFRAREAIVRRLPDGEPLRKEIARELCMGERTLQRRLGEEGTSYQQLVDDTRRELARQYLHQNHLSLAQAAYLLGFADQSTFFRACRRWFDMPPGRYRAQLERGGDART